MHQRGYSHHRGTCVCSQLERALDQRGIISGEVARLLHRITAASGELERTALD